MNILFDIGHPAHVHLFRNPMEKLLKRGHEIFVIARDKEISHYLLSAYGIEYYRGTIQKTGIGAPVELIQWFCKVYKMIKEFDIDIVLSIGSPGGALASKFCGIPHLVFNDTESATSQRFFYKFGATQIFTPNCYRIDLGPKHVHYKGYHELSYLHPDYFTPDPSVLDLLGVRKGQRFTIIRFVRWGATHDRGHSGLSPETKVKATKAFENYGKVFITSECDLPHPLKPYRIKIPPERIHDALYYASLLYGESATMASECSILGTPAIYLDNEGRGYTDEQEEKYGTVFNYTESTEDQEASIAKGIEILGNENTKQEWAKKRTQLLADTIDVANLIYKSTEIYNY